MPKSKAKRTTRETRKPAAGGTAQTGRTADAAVRSVIPDDVLRNLEHTLRRGTIVRQQTRSRGSYFAC